jgi:hypothetical protein
MTFIHPLLLTGLLLAGIPVLIHLIMRQKPKRLLFPAFQFLLQKHRTNQRSLRLRHLLLLALRIALIVAMCLALARPKLSWIPGPWSAEQPAAAVLLFDTSYSMEYTVAGKTRLHEAKARAQELLNELPDGSRVAILDSAELGGEWTLNVDQARQRIGELKLRHANAPLNRQIDQAYRLFNDLEENAENPTERLPRFLYVFSDRTTGCWDPGAASNQKAPDGLQAAFVDVGAKDPEDVAILSVEAVPPVVAAGNPVEIKVTIRATGKTAKPQFECKFDDEKTAMKAELEIPPGTSKSYTFPRETTEESAAGSATSDRLKPGLHQISVRICINDDLMFNNTGFATFAVREGRRVLVVADDPRDARLWADALNADPAFLAVVNSTKEAEDVELKRYAVVCLLDAEKPTRLWAKLVKYVSDGGRLAVVPGGDGWKPDLSAYNDDGDARELLPGRLEKVVEVSTENKVDGYWSELLPNSTAQHPFLEKFRQWRKRADIDFFQESSLPWANRFWQVKPGEQSQVIVHYAKGDQPALLERNVGKGRVLLFTTAFDARRDQRNRFWNNYNEGISFYFVLVNHAVGYLAGDTDAVNLNYICGQTIIVNLPESSKGTLCTLQGTPGVSTSESNLPRPSDEVKLIIPDAKTGTPGNFWVTDDKGVRIGDYSLNSRSEESLLEPVPVEQIEKILGPGSVVPVGHDRSLREALQGHWNQPLDLLPWLLIAVLLVLAVENLLANRFYRRETPTNPDNPV